jgi:redox-sensitive bicupin YhaK (pirin superfamily)
MRSIEKVVNSENVMMGQFQISQPLPVKQLRQVDPFLLLHHAGPKSHNPGAKGLNVEAHPHTGFEPVTFVFSGEVEHRDSLGNESIIKSGGVQWITAGKGIVHSEKASPEFQLKGGEFEIIQLWINLPKKLKKTEPKYYGYDVDDIPFYLSTDKKVRLNIVSGNFKTITGPVNSITGITAYTANMQGMSNIDLEFKADENVIFYVLSGHVKVGDIDIRDKQLVVFKKDGKQINVQSLLNSKLLILAGNPIKEPVYHYGPFVLNSKDEVIDAIKDYESGKMGYLD